MKVINLKHIGLVIATIFVDISAYAQTTNMQLPPQVGVYNPNIKGPQMALPQQVGVYQAPIQNQRMPQPPLPQQPLPYNYKAPTINYNAPPLINDNLYEQVNGYKTPNRYAFNQQPQIVKTAYNNQKPTYLTEDYGVEYYMLLDYGKTTFDGKGLVGSAVGTSMFDTTFEFPLNHYNNSLGDANNLAIGFGVMSKRDYKVEIFYNNLSGLSYGEYATASNQLCFEDFVNGEFYYDCDKELSVEGGGISSYGFNIGGYVSIADFFGGKFLDGLINPYIGGSIGITFNTLNDYTTYDDIGNAEAPLYEDGEPWDIDGAPATPAECEGNPNCMSNAGYYEYDGTITHYGATTNNISWSIEAGLSFELDSKTLLDVYYKHNNYGKVKSKGEIYYSYGTVEILDPTDEENTGNETGYPDFCTSNAIDSGYVYNQDTGWCELDGDIVEGIIYDAGESGTIENNEIGVKLRLIF